MSWLWTPPVDCDSFFVGGVSESASLLLPVMGPCPFPVSESLPRSRDSLRIRVVTEETPQVPPRPAAYPFRGKCGYQKVLTDSGPSGL